MTLQFTYDRDGVSLAPAPSTGLVGMARKLLGGGQAANQDRLLGAALADLQAVAEELGERVEVGEDLVWMTHRVMSDLPAEAADALGLPPLVDLTLRTDVMGNIGSPNYRLSCEWLRDGVREHPVRTGAILQTSGAGAGGLRRLPRWMFDAIEISDGFRSEADLEEHWAALARFRRAMEPEERIGGPGSDAGLSMTEFLSGLEVTLADRFSISPKESDHFDIVPFSGDAVEALQGADETIGEDAAELRGGQLRKFQDLVSKRGGRPAYKVGKRSYLVVDSSAAPVLQVMHDMQGADWASRADFIKNPRRRITEAIAAHMRERGELDGLLPAEEEELIESVSDPVFVETKEYSARVTGLQYHGQSLPEWDGPRNTWLPEAFDEDVARFVEALPSDRLEALIEKVEAAIEAGTAGVKIDGVWVPATKAGAGDLKGRLKGLRDLARGDDVVLIDDEDESVQIGRIILGTEQNIEELRWKVELKPRTPHVGTEMPDVVRTALKPHQNESLQWQMDAWTAGLPGILNADEQGLGKTLQTMSFLAWVKENLEERQGEPTGPVLVVAPTSLLENWQQEVRIHMVAQALGEVIPLYGSEIGHRRRIEQGGASLKAGGALLDFSDLHKAIEEGRGHRHWVLTTYTTLTNHQHSLGKIPFSTAVFDEIQFIKNPKSLRALAAFAMNADFRIGLTGTPIENSTTDLWSIMDQLSPGCLGDLPSFRSAFREPKEGNMKVLHSRLFSSQGAVPPLAMRRLKEDVAADLPEKRRLIHPRPMPEGQAAAYEDARIKMATRSIADKLRMLNHIRTVSAHPDFGAALDDNAFVAASARLEATMDLLRMIRDRGERVLVFVEHVRMQYRFIDIVKREFNLAEVGLINGGVSVRRRQEVVDRFQENLKHDGGFGVLVLAPRAAGTGLTLTAATHVIHLSRWWNPAVEEQCNDRVHRIGQTRAVTVHIPMAIHPDYAHGSFDCILHSLMVRKCRLASAALWPMGDTGEEANQLQKQILEGQDAVAAAADPVNAAMAAMFERDDARFPERNPDGSFPYL